MLSIITRILVESLYLTFFFFSSRRRHTRFKCDWSSDVCSSDLGIAACGQQPVVDRCALPLIGRAALVQRDELANHVDGGGFDRRGPNSTGAKRDRKSVV